MRQAFAREGIEYLESKEKSRVQHAFERPRANFGAFRYLPRPSNRMYPAANWSKWGLGGVGDSGFGGRRWDLQRNNA